MVELIKDKKSAKIFERLLNEGYDSYELFNTLFDRNMTKMKTLKGFMNEYNVTIGIALKV